MSSQGHGQSEVAAFAKEADLMRFYVGWMLNGAEVMGDSMDAPVRLRDDMQAVTLTSLTHFMKRYDEARKAFE